MIEVLHPGIYTSIQDSGRPGYRAMGVPVSGVMDRNAAALANTLVGNDTGEAVFESAWGSLRLFFHCPAVVAVSGAPVVVSIEGKNAPMNTAIKLPEGSELEMGFPEAGVYSYLAIGGGISSEELLGSQSFMAGITKKVKLEKGDRWSFGAAHSPLGNKDIAIKSGVPFHTGSDISVWKGPEWEEIPGALQKRLMRTTYTLNRGCNRIGYRLDGLQSGWEASIPTVGIRPGTVQLTPSGQLIAMMRDAPTTGGYPRVFQLPERSLAMLVQKRPGEHIRWSWMK